MCPAAEFPGHRLTSLVYSRRQPPTSPHCRGPVHPPTPVPHPFRDRSERIGLQVSRHEYDTAMTHGVADTEFPMMAEPQELAASLPTIGHRARVQDVLPLQAVHRHA